MRSPTLLELLPPPPDRTGWPWTEESPQLPDTMSDGSPWPRVSIITPSYNQAQFIEGTIRSVLLQGYPDLEYIVMDGGSTDESVETIRRYSPWLHYWVSEHDGGQTDAIDRGWRLAGGSWIAWLNSDDLLEPDSLAIAVQTAVSCGADLLAGANTIVDAQGNPISKGPAEPFDPVQQLFGNTIPQPGTLVRRTTVAEIGWLDASLHYVMDWELWFRIGLGRYKIVTCPQPLARFRIWSDSKTGSTPLRFTLERLRVLDKIYLRADLPQRVIDARYAAYTYQHLQTALCYHLMGNLESTQAHLCQAVEWAKQDSNEILWEGLGETLLSVQDLEDIAKEFAASVEAEAVRQGVDRMNRNVYRNLMAAAHVVRAWDSRQRGDIDGVRRHLLSVFCLRPSLFRKRGLAALAAKSLVGSTIP